MLLFFPADDIADFAYLMQLRVWYWRVEVRAVIKPYRAGTRECQLCHVLVMLLFECKQRRVSCALPIRSTMMKFVPF